MTEHLTSTWTEKAPNKWSRAGHHPGPQRGTRMRRGPSATTHLVTLDSVLPQGTLSPSFTLGMLRVKSLKRKKVVKIPTFFPLWREKQANTVLALSTTHHDLVQVTSNSMCLCALIYPAVKVK